MELLHEGEFWVLVAAVVFVALVGRRVFRAISAGLDASAARIKGELDEARRLREEAERLVAEYQAKQQQATSEAEAIIAHAKTEAERVAAQAARDLEQMLQRRQHMAEERIAQAEAKALDEVRAAAIEIAIVAAREVIAAQVDERRGSALIDEEIVAPAVALIGVALIGAALIGAALIARRQRLLDADQQLLGADRLQQHVIPRQIDAELGQDKGIAGHDQRRDALVARTIRQHRAGPVAQPTVGDDQVVVAARHQLVAAFHRLAGIDLVIGVEQNVLDEQPQFGVILNQQDVRHVR
jgi:F-type H+-transporting ATPase subunit b